MRTAITTMAAIALIRVVAADAILSPRGFSLLGVALLLICLAWVTVSAAMDAVHKKQAKAINAPGRRK